MTLGRGASCIDLLVPTVRQLIQYYVKHAYQMISLIVPLRKVQVVQVERKLDELQVELGDVVWIIHGARIATGAETGLRYAMGRMEYTFNDPIYAIY
jgi:hypothetical protein